MGEQLPITSVWLTCQRPARDQRRGRYVEETKKHPAKMVPDLAAHAIKAYTAPGDLVVDPMCGSGTTLVEAARSGRDSIGVDIEPEFTALAQANLALAAEHGHTSRGQAVTGDARHLDALVPASSSGNVALVLTSPPYGRNTHGIVSNAPGEGVHKRHYVYGDRSTGNLAYLGMDRLLDGWRQIVAGSMQVLRPGGVFVFSSRPVRGARDDLIDLPGELFTAALSVGLEPVERCVALLVAVRDGQLIHRAAVFALMAARKARADGIPVSLVAHEDVYVLRNPRLAPAGRRALPAPAGEAYPDRVDLC